MQRLTAPCLYGFPRSNVFHVLTTQAVGGVTDLSKDSIPYAGVGFNSLPDMDKWANTVIHGENCFAVNRMENHD